MVLCFSELWDCPKTWLPRPRNSECLHHQIYNGEASNFPALFSLFYAQFSFNHPCFLFQTVQNVLLQYAEKIVKEFDVWCQQGKNCLHSDEQHPAATSSIGKALWNNGWRRKGDYYQSYWHFPLKCIWHKIFHYFAKKSFQSDEEWHLFYCNSILGCWVQGCHCN